MPQSATNLLFMQSEKVLPKLQEWVNRVQTPANLIPKRNVEMVGERDFRVPAMTQEAGREGSYDPNFGEIGRGQSLQGAVAISTFYPLRMAFEISDSEVDATSSSEKAVKSAFRTVISRAPQAFAEFINKTFFTDGTPVLATASSQATVSGDTQYTMSSDFGVQRLRTGQYVNVYSNDLLTARNSGTAVRIRWIDYQNRKVCLTGTIGSAANTDHLCFEGISGASPTGVQGLYYWISTATTGTTATINRASEPEVRSNSVSGSGGLNHILGLNLLHQMYRRRGMESVSGLVGIAGLAQHAEAVQNVMNVQRIDVGGVSAEMKDLLPGAKMTFPFAGVNHMAVPHQKASAIHWISPQKNWGVARMHDVKYHEVGGTRFFPIYGSAGSPAAGQWFALKVNQNFFCSNPGAEGFIDSLPVNAPYA